MNFNEHYFKRTLVFKSTILIFFITVSFQQIIGQQQNTLPYLQSPNAAGLGSFGSYDVSAFTGLPNISIPVFSAKEGDIPINCELRYMGGGVKPSSHPGWVGQNWSLSVGGVVTRKVNGGVDEVAISQIGPNSPNINTWSYLINYNTLLSADWATIPFIQNYWNTSTNGNSSDFTKMSYPAPDEFSFTLPTGISGSFYLNQFNNWVVQTKSSTNLKINVQTNSTTLNNYPNGTFASLYRVIYTITITDELGDVYTFGNNADAIDFSRGARSGTHSYNEDIVANAWYLTKIQSAAGNIVNFTYTRHENIYIQNASYPSAETISSTSLLDASGGYRSQQTSTNYSGQIISPVYLSQISCSSFSINFNASPSTELTYPYRNIFNTNSFNYSDLEYLDKTFTNAADINLVSVWYELNSIVVNDFNGNTREKFAFNYNNSPSQRLFLNQFRKVNLDNSGNDIVYGFAYNTTALPPYNSLQLDQWGYYNNIQFPSSVTVNQSLMSYFVMNNSFAQAGILQSINFPTGGSTIFNWEPNEYSNVIQNSGTAISLVPQTGIGGGLRVASIVNSDNSGKAYTKRYVYKKITNGIAGSSSGILSGYNKIIYLNVPLGSPALVNMSFINYDDYSKCLDYTNGRDVVYSEVQEVLADGSYKIYDYSNSDNPLYMDEFPVKTYTDAFNVSVATGGYVTSTVTSSNSYPLQSHSSRELERGQLLSETEYTSGNTLLKKIQYTYNSDPARFTDVNNYVRSYDNYSVTASNGNNFTVERYFQAIKIYTYFPYLETITTTQYDQAGANPVTTTKSFSYDIYRNKKMESFRNSKSELIVNTYNYPNDYISGLSTSAFSAQTAMINGNMTGFVLESFSSNNNIPVSHTRTDYMVNVNGSVSRILLNNLNKSLLGNALELRQQYNSYDSYGNIQEEQKPLDSKHVYLWGYKGLHPVAEISGIDFATASSTVSLTNLDNPANDGYVQTEINKIRSIPGAFVKTFTYIPLIGMSSQTDASGRSIYYNYDGLGRLSYIQDQDKNIVKLFNYNYAGPIQNTATTSFPNDPQSQSFTCACSAGQTGSAVLYTVPGGRYISTVSLIDANNQALADIAANGQNYANANGTCTTNATTVIVNASSSISAQTFAVSLVNTVTGATYSFTVSYSVPGINVITVPIGTYNTSITPVGAYTSFYSFQIGGYAITGKNILRISNAAINTNFDATILIDPIGAIR